MKSSAIEFMTILRPTDDAHYLTVEEVVRLATDEFGFVQCDSKRGVRYAAERLAKSSGNVSHDEKDRMMSLMMDAVEMIIGDNRKTDKHFLKFFVIPNLPIDVLYLYDAHEMHTHHLLVRLSKVLGYTVTTE